MHPAVEQPGQPHGDLGLGHVRRLLAELARPRLASMGKEGRQRLDIMIEMASF